MGIKKVVLLNHFKVHIFLILTDSLGLQELFLSEHNVPKFYTRLSWREIKNRCYLLNKYGSCFQDLFQKVLKNLGASQVSQ